MALIRIGLFLLSIMVLAGAGSPAYSQDKADTIEGMGQDAEIPWIWGEAVSVDPAKNEIVIRHLDYDNDAEKETTISVDEKTVFENANSIADIKVKDSLSIDYVSAGGKSVARNISVEKPEDIQETEAGNMSQVSPAAEPAVTEKDIKSIPGY